MGIKIEYRSIEEMPCPNLRKAAEALNNVADKMAGHGEDTETLTGKCRKCGLAFMRVELLDGGIAYLPGNGWPGKCKQMEVYEQNEEPKKKKNPWLR